MGNPKYAAIAARLVESGFDRPTVSEWATTRYPGLFTPTALNLFLSVTGKTAAALLGRFYITEYLDGRERQHREKLEAATDTVEALRAALESATAQLAEDGRLGWPQLAEKLRESPDANPEFLLTRLDGLIEALNRRRPTCPTHGNIHCDGCLLDARTARRERATRSAAV